MGQADDLARVIEESKRNESAALERLVRAEWAFLLRERDGWSLTRGPQDLELVAHALRCVVHLGEIEPLAAEFEALAAVQQADGGFSGESRRGESTVWVSAFCGLMLLRGNQALGRDRLDRAVKH